MTRWIAGGLVVTGLLLLTGCASRAPRAAAAKPTPIDEPQELVIVKLVGQHQTITVTSGPDGPLYSASTADGQPIFANATLDELREQHPEVYQYVEPSIAVQADVGAAVPDLPGKTPSATRGGVSRDVLMLDSSR
jgi:type IV pilus biogenesis protein CpaD/CtpE